MHVATATTLLRHRFPECLTDTLHHLLDLSAEGVAPPEWWRNVHAALAQDAGKMFAGSHAHRTAMWVAPWLEAARKERGALDKCLGASFEPVCLLLQTLVGLVAEDECGGGSGARGTVSFEEQFKTLRAVYRPLLCAAHDKGRAPSWAPGPEGTEKGRCAVVSLVAAVHR